MYACNLHTTMSTITHKSLTYKILVYLSNIGLNTTVSSTYKQDELCMLLSDTQKWFGDTHVCMHVSQHMHSMHVYAHFMTSRNQVH